MLPPLPRAGAKPPRSFDLGFVVAIAWLICAVVGTLLWGSKLGLRGTIWLAVHHVLCVVGCTHEIRRAWYRRKRDRL